MRSRAWLIALSMAAGPSASPASAAPGLDFSKPLVLRAGSSVCRKPMVDCHRITVAVPVAILMIAKPYFLLHALGPSTVSAEGWVKSYMLENGPAKDCAVLKAFGTDDPYCAR